jgi:[ribosomal protein S5]-alanine N-acetyltransferase
MSRIIFETQRLRIAQYTPEHMADVYALNSHPDVMRYIRPVKNLEECEVFLRDNIAFYQQEPFMGRWRMSDKVTGTAVGAFAVIPIEGTTDIQLGYSLLPPYWGMGYATESTRGGIAYAFTIMKLQTIYGITEIDNSASQHVLLKCGFTFVEDYAGANNRALRRFVLRNNKHTG